MNEDVNLIMSKISNILFNNDIKFTKDIQNSRIEWVMEDDDHNTYQNETIIDDTTIYTYSFWPNKMLIKTADIFQLLNYLNRKEWLVTFEYNIETARLAIRYSYSYYGQIPCINALKMTLFWPIIYLEEYLMVLVEVSSRKKTVEQIMSEDI